MRGIVPILLFIALGAALIVGLMAANYSPGNVSWTGAGFQVRDPRIDAQAQAIEQQAQDAAALARLEQERQALDNATEQRAQWAAVAMRVVMYLGIGLGAALLFVGGAVALNTWLVKRAGAIYPNQAGQYPVVAVKGFGWQSWHDPNRGLGPTAIYKTPTIIDQVAALVLALRSGQAPTLPGPVAEFPPTGDQATMLQVASQAQAVGLMAAATREQWPTIGGQPKTREEKVRLVQSVTGMPAAMPKLRVIDDPQAVADFTRLLERGGQ